MHIVQVDERDSRWEDHDPRFRVYFFLGAGPPYSTDTYDVTGADVSEVIRWAAHRSQPHARFAIALVHGDARGERGLVWLLGDDRSADSHS